MQPSPLRLATREPLSAPGRNCEPEAENSRSTAKMREPREQEKGDEPQIAPISADCEPASKEGRATLSNHQECQ